MTQDLSLNKKESGFEEEKSKKMKGCRLSGPIRAV